MPARGAIFFVSEEEYPKLQKACPADFPFSYGEFVSRVNEGIKYAPGTIAKVKVNMDKFLEWCAENKVKPINTSRAQYAALMLAKQSQN